MVGTGDKEGALSPAWQSRAGEWRGGRASGRGGEGRGGSVSGQPSLRVDVCAVLCDLISRVAPTTATLEGDYLLPEEFTPEMRVPFEWDRDLEEWDWSGAGEPPSEEFWSRFEELPDENLDTLFAEVVRNHDCMWAGSCHSSDCRPETPASSETEDEPALPVSQVTGQVTNSPLPQTHFDHDYQKKVRTEHLGVQTPSDSEEEAEESSSSSSEEEEIDVVSVGPLARNLPTNPTTRVRRRLQETVADSLLTASRAVSRRLQAKRRKPRFRCSVGDTEKRSLHNNMERMRRIDLRNAFEELRLLVPTIADTQKAAKVTILKDATHYVKELGFKDRNLSLQKEALRSEQDRLRKTLSQLRRILAFKNRFK